MPGERYEGRSICRPPSLFVTSLCFGGPELKTLYVTTGWNGSTTEATKADDVGGAVFMRPVDAGARHYALSPPTVASVQRRLALADGSSPTFHAGSRRYSTSPRPAA